MLTPAYGYLGVDVIGADGRLSPNQDQMLRAVVPSKPLAVTSTNGSSRVHVCGRMREDCVTVELRFGFLGTGLKSNPKLEPNPKPDPDPDPKPNPNAKPNAKPEP